MANPVIETVPLQSHSPLGDQDYEFIRRVVYDHSRINLGGDKKVLVATRVAKRLRKLGLSCYSDYCRLLRGPKGVDELTFLVDVISTNHTHFFRESKHFDFLQLVVLPEFAARQSKSQPFRVWSAASSSGEEAYSIAILLAEFAAKTPGFTWFIEASDISTQILAKASAAIYPADRLESVPRELQRKYFQKGFGGSEGLFKVKEAVRNQVRFHHLNLLQANYPWTQPFDVVFCRNVMIYFDRHTQETLVEKLSGHITPGGHLIVGHSESLSSVKHSLKGVQPAVYRKP